MPLSGAPYLVLAGLERFIENDLNTAKAQWATAMVSETPAVHRFAQ
ncbi:hypothetical protein [Antarctobacter heliothermus]|nr:hypothetical protein [Antarctobacter heliothermus]